MPTWKFTLTGYVDAGSLDEDKEVVHQVVTVDDFDRLGVEGTKPPVSRASFGWKRIEFRYGVEHEHEVPEESPPDEGYD